MCLAGYSMQKSLLLKRWYLELIKGEHLLKKSANAASRDCVSLLSTELVYQHDTHIVVIT